MYGYHLLPLKMTTTLSISQLITDAIESLPEKVRYKCDRAKIDKWLERYGCTCDAELPA